MLDWLIDLDTALFLALNGALPLLDGLMWWVSVPWVWVPLYLLMLWRLAQQHPNWQPRVAMVVGMALCVTATDVVSAKVLKPSVARLRPSHEPTLAADIHLLEERPGQTYTGGRYGFVSSHASNHMGIAVLMGSLLGGIWLRGLVLWAVLIGWSRIHLGVHYPGDVLCGWIVGWGLGAASLTFVRRTLHLCPPHDPHTHHLVGGVPWRRPGERPAIRSGPRAGVRLVAFRHCISMGRPGGQRLGHGTSGLDLRGRGRRLGQVLGHMVLPHGGGLRGVQHFFHVCLGHVAVDAA